jgi:hypothetical protein
MPATTTLLIRCKSPPWVTERSSRFINRLSTNLDGRYHHRGEHAGLQVRRGTVLVINNGPASGQSRRADLGLFGLIAGLTALLIAAQPLPPLSRPETVDTVLDRLIGLGGDGAAQGLCSQA